MAKYALSLILLLIILTERVVAQKHSSSVYEIINKKIELDNLSRCNFYYKTIFIEPDDLKCISDSLNNRTCIVVDSNEKIIEQYKRWYFDSSIHKPIKIDLAFIKQININNKAFWFKKSKIIKQENFIRKINKSDKRVFRISRPIFFDNGKRAVLFYYFYNQFMDTKYFFEIYSKNPNNEWNRTYTRLIWLS